MRLKPWFLLFLPLVATSSLPAQPRWAIVTVHGAPKQPNPAIHPLMEQQIADRLTTQFAGRPDLALVDRAMIGRILKEQNLDNGNRASPETAARIGKLLGAGQMLLVQIDDFSYTTHPEQSGNTTRTTATVVMRASARLVDVETGVIQAQPSARFQESIPVTEVSKSRAVSLGPVQIPQKTTASGGDPKVIADNEREKAIDAMARDLGAKLDSVLSQSAQSRTSSALVAGIANGAVYIDKGSAAGVKAGDRFQVFRQVSVGINDPTTGQPLLRKERVCMLTIVEVNETNASGSCQGGIPQTKDQAETM